MNTDIPGDPTNFASLKLPLLSSPQLRKLPGAPPHYGWNQGQFVANHSLDILTFVCASCTMFLCASLISDDNLKLRRSVTAIFAFAEGPRRPVPVSVTSVELLAFDRVMNIVFIDG